MTQATFTGLMHAAVLAMVIIGAFTDWRGGIIPNWLTFPALLLGPALHAGHSFYLYGSLGGGLLFSVTGLLVCGFVPWAMFKLGGMAGGDVKLFAAIGAFAGAQVGLEAELLSFIVASIYALGRFVWDGRLFRTLGNAFYVTFNPILPKRFKREISPELLHRMRLGMSIALGTALALSGQHPTLWS